MSSMVFPLVNRREMIPTPPIILKLLSVALRDPVEGLRLLRGVWVPLRGSPWPPSHSGSTTERSPVSCARIPRSVLVGNKGGGEMIAKGTGFLLEVVRDCSRTDWGDACTYLWKY